MMDFYFLTLFYEFFTAYTLILVLYSYTSTDYTAYISTVYCIYLYSPPDELKSVEFVEISLSPFELRPK